MEKDEIAELLRSGCVGVQLSADASSMLGHEMLASALYLNGCMISEAKLGIDGFPRMEPFVHKYVSPLLSIESKGAAHLAWCLTQVLAFFGLVEPGCEIADVHKKLTSHFYHYFSDQGSENTGGWRNAYEHGVGGAFEMLFVKVSVRRSASRCTTPAPPTICTTTTLRRSSRASPRGAVISAGAGSVG